MNLNLELLEERLSNHFQIIDTCRCNPTRFLYRTMLYAETPMLDDGTIYVAKGGELSEEPCLSSTCALVSIGTPPKGYQKGCYNYIILDTETELPQVFNELQRTFFHYFGWCDTLHRTLYQEKGIKAIIKEALPMLGNPIYMYDKNYRIIAYAENRGLPGIRYDFLKRGRFSAKFIYDLMKIPGFLETFKTIGPAYCKKTKETVVEFNYLYVNLHLNGEYYGRIFTDERVRPITKADYVVLDELASVIELALQRRNLFENSRLRYFGKEMVRLLDGENTDPQKMDEELQDLGWSRSSNFYCIEIDLAETDALFNATESICDLLESKLQDCQVFPYRENIVIIVNGRNSPIFSDVFLEDFRTILEELSLHAGVSLMFQDLGKLKIYHEQTKIALSFGKENDPETRIYRFENYSLDYILKHSVDEFTATMLCPRSLLTLMQYDQKNGTVYAETLRIYLECDSSPAQAMSRLFIHRSTLLYRLNRIQKIIDVDLTDIRIKLHFLLAFQMMDREFKSEKLINP